MRHTPTSRHPLPLSSSLLERRTVPQKHGRRSPFQRTCATSEDKESASSSRQPQKKEGNSEQVDATSSNIASGEELRELADARRQRSREDNLGLVEGILDETRRITWPTPIQALKDTTVVVGIVAVSAVVLFGINSALTEGSKLLYDNFGK